MNRKARKIPAPVLTVKAPKAFETRTGLFWSGVLIADNLPVLRFENRGDGGSLHLDWRPQMEPEFRASIEAAIKAKASADALEPLDDGLGWLWDVAVCGSEEEASKIREAA